MPVIVDTTVWIDLFRGASTPQLETLTSLLRRGEVAMGDLILTEVMQGVTTQREFTHLKRHFEHFPVYTMVGRQIALQSAVNYRKLRAQGITVRKTIDCWIATFCIQRGFLLLHSDRDFDPFEKHLGLRTPS